MLFTHLLSHFYQMKNVFLNERGVKKHEQYCLIFTKWKMFLSMKEVSKNMNSLRFYPFYKAAWKDSLQAYIFVPWFREMCFFDV